MKRKWKIRPIIPHPTDPSLALVELTRGYYATISIVDATDVGQFNWTARVCPNTVYAFRCIHRPDGTQETVSLHRFIADKMALPRSMEVDHEGGNGLDCRRSNLREATRSQNQRNRSRPRKGSKSGIKGVSWSSSKRRWRVQVMVDRVCHRLGYFRSLEDARKAAEDGITRLHGSFANHGRRLDS